MERHGLVERARELAPPLYERASEAEALRRLPDATIKDLHAAGLFRALQPVRYGGLGADYCRSRVMSDRSKAVDDPFVQAGVAELDAAVDGARCQLRSNLEEMKALAEAGEQPTLERRARYCWDAARMTRTATEVVDSAFGAAGGRALFLDNPLQRALRDVHAMRGHANNNPEKTAQIYGRAVLGFPNKEFLL